VYGICAKAVIPWCSDVTIHGLACHTFTAMPYVVIRNAPSCMVTNTVLPLFVDCWYRSSMSSGCCVLPVLQSGKPQLRITHTCTSTQRFSIAGLPRSVVTWLRYFAMHSMLAAQHSIACPSACVLVRQQVPSDEVVQMLRILLSMLFV
jgi:hypothetical protein